jgi:hypothetical protein
MQTSNATSSTTTCASIMAYAKKVKIMSASEQCQCSKSPTMAEFVRSAYDLNQRIKAKGSERCLRKSVLQGRLWRQLRRAFFDPRVSHLGLAEAPALTIHERQCYPCQCNNAIKGRTRLSLQTSWNDNPAVVPVSSAPGNTESLDVDSIASSIQQHRSTQPSACTSLAALPSAAPSSPTLPLQPTPSTPFVVRARQRRPCRVRSPEGVAMVLVATSDI